MYEIYRAEVLSINCPILLSILIIMWYYYRD